MFYRDAYLSLRSFSIKNLNSSMCRISSRVNESGFPMQYVKLILSITFVDFINIQMNFRL